MSKKQNAKFILYGKYVVIKSYKENGITLSPSIE